jgi:sentrin-specific protease 1
MTVAPFPALSDLRLAIASVPPTPRYDAMRKECVEISLLQKLPKDAVALIDTALRERDGERALNGEDCKVPVTRPDLETLQGVNWLNDEIINAHLQLMAATWPDLLHTFNTFFYTKLSKQGYDGVARWTRNTKIFIKRLILVPIHTTAHWTLVIVDNQDKSVTYYDGLGGRNESCVRSILDYLTMEGQAKNVPAKTATDYTADYANGIPRQKNGHDCGVFLLVYALCVVRGVLRGDGGGAVFPFSQKDMPYFRRRISYELLTNKLLPLV